jgi:HEPN domain-containing protein
VRTTKSEVLYLRKMNRFRDWMEQAERDPKRAEIDVRHEFWEWACFTAQQAAEKAVKALLMNRGAAVRGHAITPMLRQLPDLEVPRGILELGQLLAAYYIPTRYPNGFPQGKPADYFNESKAGEAVDAAQELFRFCHDHLS